MFDFKSRARAAGAARLSLGSIPTSDGLFSSPSPSQYGTVALPGRNGHGRLPGPEDSAAEPASLSESESDDVTLVSDSESSAIRVISQRVSGQRRPLPTRDHGQSGQAVTASRARAVGWRPGRRAAARPSRPRQKISITSC